MLPSLYDHVASLTGRVGTAVEVPCSGGTGLLHLRRFCDAVTGVDLSEEHVGWAAHRIAGEKGVDVAVGDLADLDARFTGDLVLVPREGLQFIADTRDVGGMVTSLARAVRPGGWLVLDCFDFRSARVASPTDTPRYFRPDGDTPSVTTAVLHPASGQRLQRCTVVESVTLDQIEFSSTYQLNDRIVRRDFVMAQYDPVPLEENGHQAGLVLDAVGRSYRPPSAGMADETGRRVVVFRKS